ncbi:ABC transporter ATP-binding protein, partial [Cereibacter sphaeroides]|nr:ABC transporter ATP-binding protein [Cereibacter sphaeroides]
RKITDDPYGAWQLIRRLVMEQAAAYWRRYALAFGLMAIAAAATSGSAFLLGKVINQAYVDRDLQGIM